METLTSHQRKLIRDRINAHRIQDKRKGRDYSQNLKFADWIEQYKIQDGKCWYTGLPLTIGGNGANEASLERIDCSQGHSEANCVLICASLNFSRGNKNLVEFCKYLANLGILDKDATIVLRELKL